MAVAVRLTQTGHPDVMKLEQIDEVAPGPKEARVEHEAIGVNYLDVTQRNGSVPIALPSGLGLEGAGCVTAIGPEVTNVAVGDLGYALGPLGSYASSRLYPAERPVTLQDTMSFEQAAAILFKGITAHAGSRARARSSPISRSPSNWT